MSIAGLYDSPVTDRMARALLARHSSYIDYTKVLQKSGQRCSCGNLINRVPKVRGGKKVCDVCAAKTPRKHGGQKAKTKCTKCKVVGSAASMRMVNKKRYCKVCAPTIKKKDYKRNI